MSPQTIISEPRPLSRQPRRLQTAVATTPRSEGLVIRPFAAPVVREIPARREAVLAGTW